jgi:hypothetical protein
MTLQIADRLWIEGRCYPLLGTPMRWCTDASVTDRIKALTAQSTLRISSLWRGYVGVWRVHEGTLFLEELNLVGNFRRPGQEHLPAPTGLELVWPGSRGPIRATWLTGKLHAGDGEPYRSLYQEVWPVNIALTVVEGIVTHIEREDRRAAVDELRAHDEARSSIDLDDFGLLPDSDPDRPK